jgi:hypothetical protein
VDPTVKRFLVAEGITSSTDLFQALSGAGLYRLGDVNKSGEFTASDLHYVLLGGVRDQSYQKKRATPNGEPST